MACQALKSATTHLYLQPVVLACVTLLAAEWKAFIVLLRYVYMSQHEMLKCPQDAHFVCLLTWIYSQLGTFCMRIIIARHAAWMFKKRMKQKTQWTIFWDVKAELRFQGWHMTEPPRSSVYSCKRGCCFFSFELNALWHWREKTSQTEKVRRRLNILRLDVTKRWGIRYLNSSSTASVLNGDTER